MTWGARALAPTRTDVYFHGADPSVLDHLKETGISLWAPPPTTLGNTERGDSLDKFRSRGLLDLSTPYGRTLQAEDGKATLAVNRPSQGPET